MRIAICIEDEVRQRLFAERVNRKHSVDCLSDGADLRRLAVAGVGYDFSLLQALRPSLAFDIPEQAAWLGAGRRQLERWFQGPDVCSARRLQSLCAAGEAMYLRLEHGTRDREIAGVIGLL